jgi:hypothetical protein
MSQFRFFIFFLVFFLCACQRSAQFKKDSELGKEDFHEGMIRDRAGSDVLSKKIEAIGQPKKRVMILDFWNDTPIQLNEMGFFVADELKRGLHLSQKVIVSLDGKSDFSTRDFVQGDQIKVAQLIREGRKLGVSVVAIGRISKMIYRQKGDDVGLFRQKQSLMAVDIEMKLFDVQGGREILATSKSGESSANGVAVLDDNDMNAPTYRTELAKIALREAVAQCVPDVVRAVEKLTWQGRIAKMIGPKIYINAGRTSGLIAGDILRVINQGDEVYDPATGALLGRAQGQLKGTLEVMDFIGPDGAVADVHTGGNFHEGDLVQLY